MRLQNLPGLIDSLCRPSIPAFAALFTLEPLTRSVIVTVVPLMVYERFGTLQNVSLFFFILGIFGVAMSLAVPWLLGKLLRRGTLSLGAITGVIAMLLFMHGETWSLFAGMALHLFAASCIDVSLNLYMMDNIRRREFGQFEPVRMFFLGFSWSVGPFLGVFLRNTISPAAPFIFSAGTVLVLTGYFFFLRFQDQPVKPGKRPPVTNPMKYLPRFFQQPRLRLAYVLSFMRSGWWTMYFIYVPIFFVTSGLGETLGGLMVSLSTAFTMLTPLWRGPLRRFGMRYILYTGYFVTGITTIIISIFMDTPHVAIGIMMVAAFFAVPCDAVGNVPFYRAVHSYERSEMATVFGNYRAVSSLVFPGMYSAVLAIFQLPAVFVVTGICMIGTGWVAHYIPRRMN